MMHHLRKQVSLIVSTVFLVSCASGFPPLRITDYVPLASPGNPHLLAQIVQRPLPVGLIVVSDTAAPNASPNLPVEALDRLVASLRSDVARMIPIAIQEIIPADQILPRSQENWGQLTELGRQHGLDYLAILIASSTEQEYPLMLSLVGQNKGMVPGFRRDNFSLLEWALVDLQHKQILLQATGRAWATLDYPTAPGVNQWYPIVNLRPQENQRFWPPTYEGAPDTLRVVSFQQAARELLEKLKSTWALAVETDP